MSKIQKKIEAINTHQKKCKDILEQLNHLEEEIFWRTQRIEPLNDYFSTCNSAISKILIELEREKEACLGEFTAAEVQGK